jgi:predicted transcriptional regulator
LDFKFTFPLFSRWKKGDFSTLTSDEARHKRTLLEITAHILNACHANARKTSLMYGCNMSFSQLKSYLDMMLGAKLLLIDNNDSHPLFRISGKGKDFLKAYEGLKNLME